MTIDLCIKLEFECFKPCLKVLPCWCKRSPFWAVQLGSLSGLSSRSAGSGRLPESAKRCSVSIVEEPRIQSVLDAGGRQGSEDNAVISTPQQLQPFWLTPPQGSRQESLPSSWAIIIFPQVLPSSASSDYEEVLLVSCAPLSLCYQRLFPAYVLPSQPSVSHH